MNIFILDNSPVLAARSLGDVHINKMILESCQMLATCFTHEQLTNAPPTKQGTAWKHTHVNHPCSKWVRESRMNALWLVYHTVELLNERRFRWPKRDQHDCKRFFDWVFINLKDVKFDKTERTPFAIAIPETAKCRRLLFFDDMDAVRQYKAYYKKDKVHCHEYTKRNKPEWL